MQKHSEVEAKFRAQDLSVSDFLTYIASLTNLGTIKLEGYKQVDGDDVYYVRGEDVVRHRYDGKRRTSTLTVKKRKSADSITDRKEIDLPIKEDVSPGDVEAFLKMTGWTPLFAITKMSYIAHLICLKGTGRPQFEACLALYDVMDLSEHEAVAGWERFLEIEIEKDSNCTHEQALEYLDSWVTMLQNDLQLGTPLNESLLEMYRPKPKLVDPIKETIKDFNGRCM